ncbi:Conserved putative secreted protein [Amycolatopsis japonica]|uniref:Conserved putative secreted protein n=1 Tax=Amycolatopsis japonica TaxID=208439 RepID=A0A075UNE2_9PSEU|nr:C40 family peptidase [Amycolatopsis japonica]AIG74403.1 Conserved putative secreted protein [Amycolatopsis japonica]
MAKLAVAGVAFFVVLLLLIGGGAIAVVQAVVGSSAQSTSCIPAGATGTSIAGYGPEEMGHAATIVAVGKQMNVPETGWVIAITTAITESRLRNLTYGDRDSIGLFQQRPSQGWGSVAQIMNPNYSSEQFYRHLMALPNWQTMPVAEAAQTVQRSGFPGRYAQFEPAARQIVAAVHGATCTSSGTGDCNAIQAPTPAATAAITYACHQRGLPYIWGGNGPDRGHEGFDCSGLTKAAYGAAGIALPRTAHTQFDAGPRVPDGQPLLPGDLVFYGTPARIHHVGLYIGKGKMINAPTFGQPVQIDNHRRPRDDYVGATRPSA